MALGRLAGADVSGFTRSSFTDVPNNSSAMPYIEWALHYGIVKGVGNNQSPEETVERSPFPPQAESTSFAPNDAITREQMAVMMVNLRSSHSCHRATQHYNKWY